MLEGIWEFVAEWWTAVLEVSILAVVIYFMLTHFRGTRGAKVLTGLVIILLSLVLLSNLLNLEVLSWLVERILVFLALALVVIFQPELRRALAELGSHHFFTSGQEKRESIELLTQAVFELAHKRFGSLIALERNTDIGVIADTGVRLDSEFSKELALTIFHPKTALHDGGVIMREDRVAAAACIFPVSQREDLDRMLGLRHRAGIGLTEESDAISIVTSEETGNVSICFAGQIERNFSREDFERRLSQLLLLEKYEKEDTEELEDEAALAGDRDDSVVYHSQ